KSLLSDVIVGLFFSYMGAPSMYSLSLHDALPIYRGRADPGGGARRADRHRGSRGFRVPPRRDRRAAAVSHDRGEDRGLPRASARSEEHTSELQSRRDLVCRLLLETKKTNCPRFLT